VSPPTIEQFAYRSPHLPMAPRPVPPSLADVSLETPVIGEGATQVYPDVRALIQTGDVLLFRGRGPLSRFLQWGSQSPYSHAGFAARWEDRVLVFQATGLGAAFLSLSALVDAYDGAVDWFTPTAEVRACIDTQLLIDAAVNLLGRRYGLLQVLDLMWRVGKGRFHSRTDTAQHPERVFCSQYVSYCYRHAGRDLVSELDDASTSPGDLARSPDLVHRCTLRADPKGKAERRDTLPGRPSVHLK
jgi:hypothetical protein